MKSVTNSRTIAMIGLLMVLVAVMLCVRLAMAQQPNTPAAIQPPPAYLPATATPPAGPGAGGGASPGFSPPGAYPAYQPGTGSSIPSADPIGIGSAEYPAGIAQRTRQTEALRSEIDALVEQESYTRQLMSDYSRLVDDHERSAVARELTNVVGKHFDIRQGVRERELQRLENQLRALRDLHEKRAMLRDEIVEERVRQLLRDLDGIGWGADGLEGLESPPAAGTPRPKKPGMSAPAAPPMPGAPAAMGGPAGGGMGTRPGSGMGLPPGRMGMAMPSPSEQPTRKSLNNLKQLGLAMHNYLDTHNVFAPPVLYGPDGKTPHSWRVALLPYLDQKDLYQQYKFNEPWDSENNLQLLDKMPAVFRDPNAPSGTVFPSYFQFSGLTPEANRNGWRIDDIRDGTSNTLMLVEAKRNIPWTKPEDIPYASDKLLKLGGHHSGVFLAALYDGSAKSLPLNLDDTLLRAFITPNGGEPIDTSALEGRDTKRFPKSGGFPPTGALPTPLSLPGTGSSLPPSAAPGGPPVPASRAPLNDGNQPQGSSLPPLKGGGAPAAPAPIVPADPPENDRETSGRT